MVTLWDFISKQRAALPTEAVLSDSENNWPFDRLEEAVLSYSAMLRAAGLDERGALLLPTSNRCSQVAAILAASVVGCPIITVDDREFRQSAVFRKRLAACLGLHTVVASFDDGPRIDTLDDSGQTLGITTPTALPKEAFLLQLTSGSTGPRKLSIHSQQNVLLGMDVYRRIWGLSAEDRVVVPIPIAHSFGLIGGVLSALACAAMTIVVSSSLSTAFLRQAASCHATVVFGAPTWFEFLRDLTPLSNDLRQSVRLCLSSGMIMGPTARTACEHVFGVLPAEVYGSTETGIIAATWPTPNDYPVGTVGRVVPGVEVRNSASDETAALLEVRSPWLQLGYLDLNGGGLILRNEPWWQMGDTGNVSADGMISLTGRTTNFINLGGRKINANEVEAHLRSHPDVEDAHCYSIPGQLGEELAAIVLSSRNVEREQLVSYCRHHLGPGMAPSRLFITDKPFREVNGKVRWEQLPDAANNPSMSYNENLKLIK